VDTAKNKTVAANKAVAVKDKTERNKGIAVKTEENKAAKNNKAIKESSKRVEAQSATPNAGKRKPVPSVHSAAVAAGGE
jgi:hypothetical protein